MTTSLSIEPGAYTSNVAERLADWKRSGFASRLWDKDPTLWSRDAVPELDDRLGWLDLPARMVDIRADLVAFGQEVVEAGFRQVVVLGMGGSSLAPEVFQAVLGNRPPHPALIVLDSTHPAAVVGVADAIPIASTLFIVSSKSGTTLETMSFFRYFWSKVVDVSNAPGTQFVAVTDPGSTLEELAVERKFRRVFRAPSDVGGRYSALTEFGLVPAATIGADLDALEMGARSATKACGPDRIGDQNPGIALGAYMGELALAGRDKATFLAPPALQPLVAWIEQLVAESTGKDRRGIVPIGGDEEARNLGEDRAVIVLDLAEQTLDDELESLRQSSMPLAHLRLAGPQDLGGAMFILEVATAAAGAAIGIHPFNQPDVQLAKNLARRAMAGELDGEEVVEVSVLDPSLNDHVGGWLDGVAAPEYVGIHAYLPPTRATRAALGAARRAVRDGKGVAATFDFGPRFLHSTGQLHKGGPATGRFIQVIDHAEPQLLVPETDYTFGKLIAAQALGDYQALVERGQKVLLVSLGDSGAEGLEALLVAVAQAAAND